MVDVDLEDTVFMLAGPVKIHPRVLRVMSKPSVAHRSSEFKEINLEIRELFQYLFQSKNEVALITGSGTAGVESAISNIIRKGDKILTVDNGKFGERLFEIGRTYGTAIHLKFDWGKPTDLDKLAECLEQQDDIKAVAFVHNETSTGLTNQAREIAKLVKKYDKILIMDGITSVGGLEVKPDEWGIDFTIFGSQKCIAAPAGLSALCISARAIEEMYDDTTYYLNLRKHIEKFRVGDTPWTPAIPLFLALRESLLMLKEEGLERRIKRTEKLGIATRNAVKAIGLELFPDERYASNTVTAIKYPPRIDDREFRTILREKHRIIVAGAQDHIKGKVFRIGHMGICSFTDLLATFGGIEATLKTLGYDVNVGSSTEAIVSQMTE